MKTDKKKITGRQIAGGIAALTGLAGALLATTIEGMPYGVTLIVLALLAGRCIERADNSK